MPKIRGVKPDLWTDENFVELSPFARLLWIGLWNYACDNGHVQDKSKQIKMRVLPTDEVNCAELLREIETQGLIQRADGWITIPNLSHHQKPHKRWYVTCEKPGCEMPEGASYGFSKREPTVEQPLTNGSTTVNNGGSTADVDGDVDGDVDLMVKDAPASKPRKKPSTRLPADWTPSDEHAARCIQDGIDIDAQVARFRAHAEANDRRQVNWNAAFTQWLLNVPEWQRGQRPAQVRQLQKAHEIEQPPDGLSDSEYAAWYANRRRA